MTPPVGASGEHAAVVAEADTAIALGSGDVPVLATPRLVAWLEAAAVAALDEHLPSDATSVGTRIELEHLAPSPLGAEVCATAEVIEAAGSRILFRVEAHQGTKCIARGHHQRVVVNRKRFLNSGG